ncbi:hypothetical protein I8U17_06180 [Thermoactinomyces sp. CICC 10521]|uniref:Uncharacterized protein n=2 Tax=Thermoactinomycetaceae TaxID=186824 RepID=A0A7W1X9L0_9BACL|nr:hypothetical protein [Thermoactinomyces daqus]MBH8597401.1 hypothetical protein [Thermoactinomyces sp. CICC 10523]MBH8602962.1 hypothetical protein [Thermoactinomyces sp. CICC 10522]MBH8607190.1 hypothetical protein [Thermoactinomyces sp. CICC 10521]
MKSNQDLKHTLSYLHSELNRIETMAGTLATIEQEHYGKLTNYDHRELVDIAVEEQHAARQLGTIRQMCLAMAQKVESLKNGIDRVGPKEHTDHAEIH